MYFSVWDLGESRDRGWGNGIFSIDLSTSYLNAGGHYPSGLALSGQKYLLNAWASMHEPSLSGSADLLSSRAPFCHGPLSRVRAAALWFDCFERAWGQGCKGAKQGVVRPVYYILRKISIVGEQILV